LQSFAGHSRMAQPREASGVSEGCPP
jgi:hypothetical protein